MMWRDLIGFFTETASRYGDIARFKVGPKQAFLISHPNYIRSIFQERDENYSKTLFYDKMKPIFGEGLLTSNGEAWRRQRRIIQPIFHRDRIAVFANVVTAATHNQLERWQNHARTGQPFDIAAEMARLTQTIILRTLFSAEPGENSDALREAFTVVNGHILRRMLSISNLTQYLPTARNRRFKYALQVLDQEVQTLIDERCRGKHKDDLLSLLLRARDPETGQGMRAQQVRDEVMTAFIAGHETSANGLAWTLYLLSRNPDAEARLRMELDRVLGSRAPCFDDLPSLNYTRWVIDESLRLFPPVYALSRTALSADNIDGYIIPAGSVVVTSQFVMHRHPDYWETPERFNPERFSPQQPNERPRYVYFPFSRGPRACISNHFALMEMQLILAMAYQRFRFTLTPDKTVEPEPLLTLRPRGGIWIQASRVH